MSNSIGLGNELQVVDSETAIKRWAFHFNEDASITLERFNSDGETQGNALEITSAGAVTIDSTVFVVGPVVAPYREVANDGAVEISAADAGGTILIADSTTGTKTITTAADVEAGTVVTIKLKLATGNSYVMAVNAIGAADELTFNAAEELATIVFDGEGWETLQLQGATVV
jgi:hypothetical protein